MAGSTLSNLTPPQEPVAWYGALGILLNAIMVAFFVFAPNHGLALSAPEDGAIEGVVNGAYLLIGALVTRQAVTPIAPPPQPSPAPAPPSA
jgi:hypothetical protein